jgi:hypothetical protein
MLTRDGISLSRPWTPLIHSPKERKAYLSEDNIATSS